MHSILSKKEMCLDIVEKCLLDHRMAVQSYKQSTRYHLYYMISTILNHKQTIPKEYAERVVSWVSEEKDPRNIELVFRIFLWLIKRAPHDIEIFEHLENYYPIDFEGDESKHNISIKRIITLLDECLC